MCFDLSCRFGLTTEIVSLLNLHCGVWILFSSSALILTTGWYFYKVQRLLHTYRCVGNGVR
jgi:hypothetical protein